MTDAEPTRSLCPVCLARVPARRILRNGEARLEKTCPKHGDFSTVIWRGEPSFSGWKRPKTPSRPPVRATTESAGCPFDCGLCPEHAQHTCTTLLEVTDRCDLGCPVCFARSGAHGDDPGLPVLRERLVRIRETAGACTLQLSGGEPTMRDDLPLLVEAAAGLDFSLVQLNTNGLRFAAEPDFARILLDAGLQSVFLQFDSVRDEAYLRLRGNSLWERKQQALDALLEAGLGVVLVSTLVPGVNTRDIGALIRYGLKRHPGVRGVHFQPVSYFGRYPMAPSDADRLTLPEVMTAVEKQTDGAIPASDFLPPGCEHALCSFHATYLVSESGALQRLGQCGCSPGPAKASDGARKAVRTTSQRWRPAPGPEPLEPIDDLDRFLSRARQQTFTVSGMAFQDAWTLDLERLRGCCIHVQAPDGRLIPFCAYNLTAADGSPLYRGLAEDATAGAPCP
ncbi:radical SAM (seleno)protein TrsS [Desulfohalovibrio reitneri]|uniref:radical SAM (seleno)protein TrsS n=1 Tax=Desulfohalovibrio reitneri TaxID=1307759 RepID=UPI0004A6FFE4|nr:radical SAM (seleno)protein TrsS [Desulfohalovibrio reitneri]